METLLMIIVFMVLLSKPIALGIAIAGFFIGWGLEEGLKHKSIDKVNQPKD